LSIRPAETNPTSPDMSQVAPVELPASFGAFNRGLSMSLLPFYFLIVRIKQSPPLLPSPEEWVNLFVRWALTMRVKPSSPSAISERVGEPLEIGHRHHFRDL